VKYISGYKYYGLWWVWFWGKIMISWKDIRIHPLLFSQRKGLFLPGWYGFKIKNWYFQFNRKGK